MFMLFTSKSFARKMTISFEFDLVKLICRPRNNDDVFKVEFWIALRVFMILFLIITLIIFLTNTLLFG